MKITVAICTWNRCELLKQTLEQMQKTPVPDGILWEVLVVNNNSVDMTEEVVRSFLGTLPIRHIFEPKQGLSHSRNRAISEAHGEYILWTDDDVLVDECWISSYCDAFSKYPDASFFGGPIRPWFEGIPPSWLLKTLPQIGHVFGVRELGESSFPLEHGRLPFGANFAVRTREQNVHLFDPSLGMLGNKRVQGEETTMFRGMLDAGMTGRWVPDAGIRHYVPKANQSIKYLRKYFRSAGEAESASFFDEPAPTLFGVPRYLWRQWLTSELKYCFRRFLCHPSIWIEDLKLSSFAYGVISGRDVANG